MKLFCFTRSTTFRPGRKVHQGPKESPFKVDVDVHTCVHGYLVANKKQPTSLIIFRAQLVGTHGGVFERFYMEVTFSNVSNTDASATLAQPEIICTAPFSNATNWTQEQLREVTKHQDASCDANQIIPGLSVGAKVGRTVRKQSKLVTDGKYKFYDKCSSSTTTATSNGRPTGVWWNVEKSCDSTLKDDASLQPTYFFAVLVTRPNDITPFEAAIHLEIAARQNKKRVTSSQFFTEAESALTPNVKQLFTEPKSALTLKYIQRLVARGFCMGADAVGDLAPILFDPVKLDREGMTENIESKRLGLYRGGEKLAKLTEV